MKLGSIRSGLLAVVVIASALLSSPVAEAQSCDQLFTKYEGSSWWWGAFGNCKRSGPQAPGVDRDAIFECAWAQVPPNEKNDCLKGKLKGSQSTKNGIDAVVANNKPFAPSNVCDQLFTKYEGSSWWWGAFGNCKRPGGPTDRDAAFECAWAQVPANEKNDCLKGKLKGSQSTKNGIDAVVGFTTIMSNNRTSESPPTETCSETGPAHVPRGYFLTPNAMTDAPSPSYNQPASQGLNIGTNEGRVRPELRNAAKKADPIHSLALAAYNLGLSTIETNPTEKKNLADLGTAYADLSVTGRASYGKFKGAPPTEAQITQALKDVTMSRLGKAVEARENMRGAIDLRGGGGGGATLRPVTSPCDAQSLCGLTPNIAKLTDPAAKDGAIKALDRAYAVLNILRVANMAKSGASDDATSQRKALGWIAVSGEDDQPHHPVNVPTTKYPQFDIDITVQGKTVRTRYMIAQTQGSLASTTPASGRVIPPPATPSLAPNAEVLLFIHGMDSRLEEAEALADTLRTVAPSRNFAVISLDLPTSGYADNLDHCTIPRPNPDPSKTCTSLFELGDPKEPPQWFDAHGKHNAPVLDFIEAFIVGLVDKLDGQGVPVKAKLKAVLGGSLGGNMSLRFGRRMDLPWVRNVIPWSPASIWASLADGEVNPFFPHTMADAGSKHGGVRAGWQSAGGNAINLVESPDMRRQFFGDAFDKSILGGLVSPPQAQMWFSSRWACKQSALVGARLDRHETYNRNFRLWHWRLGTEQLIFSHVTKDAQGKWLFMQNQKRHLFLCGKDDDFPYTNICSATQIVAKEMTTTPGRAIFLDAVGHSIDTERPQWFTRKVVEFLTP